MFLKKRKKAIQQALIIRNLSHKELAKELKLSESYITRLLDGTRYSSKFEDWIKLVLRIDYTRL